MFNNWTPGDWVELVKALGALLVPVSMAYSILAASRAGRAEKVSKSNATTIAAVGANVQKLEVNTNSISERNERIARALGLTEGEAKGIAGERASVAANAQAAQLAGPGPVPVADEKTAAAVDRVKDAIEEGTAAAAKKK